MTAMSPAAELAAPPPSLSPRLQSLLRCPECRSALAWGADNATCLSCGGEWPVRGGCVDFCGAEMIDSQDADFQQERMHHRSLRARLYDLGQRFITSEYAPRDHRQSFLDQIPDGAVVVEFGSGNRRLRDDIVNLDLFPFPNVHAAADIARSPLADNSVDYAILDSVVEHVPNPQEVVEEVRRVLKPGGRLFCINPFLFQYHGYPAHYCNFTRDGMQHLLRNYSSAVVEPHYGPSSAIANILSEYVAVSVAGERRTLYLWLRAAMLLGLGWLRFLDKWLIRAPHAHRLSGMLCSIAVK